MFFIECCNMELIIASKMDSEFLSLTYGFEVFFYAAFEDKICIALCVGKKQEIQFKAIALCFRKFVLYGKAINRNLPNCSQRSIGSGRIQGNTSL